MTADGVMPLLMRRNPGIEEAPLQNELMLFDPASAKFYVLNATMAFVWKGCDGATNLADIACRLAEEFSGVEAEQASRDVSIAAADLASLGLLLDAGPHTT